MSENRNEKEHVKQVKEKQERVVRVLSYNNM